YLVDLERCYTFARYKDSTVSPENYRALTVERNAGRGMLIGMDVGKEDGEIGVRQPVRYQGPRLPAVHCLGGGERSAEIKRIARRVGVVHQDHLVVPALGAHQVHIVLVEVRVARRLSGDAKRHPV